MKTKYFEFPEDIKILKNFMKKTYNVNLNDKQIEDIWRDYSNIYAAGWLILPTDIKVLKEDKIFQNILYKYLPKYYLIKSINDRIIDICIIKEVKLNEILIKLIEKVPSFEKNYYQKLFKRKEYQNKIIDIVYYKETEQKIKFTIINENLQKNCKDLLI